jgi:hypothetical protein
MANEDMSEEEARAMKRAEYLVEQEDKILEVSESITDGLYEYFKSDRRPRTETIFTHIQDPLLRVTNEQKAAEIAQVLINYVSNFNTTNAQYLNQKDASPELYKFIQRIYSRHNRDIINAQLASTQGEEFWYRIHAEYVIRRRENTPGLNYTIDKSIDQETIELTTDMESNLRLINNILSYHLEAFDYFNLSEEDIDMKDIEVTLALAEELQRQAGNVVSEGEDK